MGHWLGLLGQPGFVKCFVSRPGIAGRLMGGSSNQEQRRLAGQRTVRAEADALSRSPWRAGG